MPNNKPNIDSMVDVGGVGPFCNKPNLHSVPDLGGSTANLTFIQCMNSGSEAANNKLNLSFHIQLGETGRLQQ